MGNEYKKPEYVNFGIDLGTTNSVMAFFDGNDASVVANLISSRNYTPSAVAIDEEGDVIVGEYAKRQSLFDPLNAAVEFKLNMGTDKKYHFEDSGMDLLAEELSGEVLKDLKNSLYKRLGKKIDSAVITVPADFSPNQLKATQTAAKLAGFRFSPMIMEPVAAAYAYHDSLNENATCLVYDLGGRTFDTSIVKIEDDDYLNLAQSNDKRLGGNIMDWDIVYKIFAKKVIADLGLDDFNRKEMKYAKAFAKLKRAAEEAKIDLYHSNKTKIYVEALMVHENEIYDFEYILSKDELEEVMAPYISRTLKHCHVALKEAKLKASDIDCIILVGGSTLSPIIKESLEDEFGIPLKDDIDPVTVVAKGAALFAATVPLPYHGPPHYDYEYELKLDYESSGTIAEEFYVSGQIISENVDNFEGFAVEAVNIKTKMSTGKIYVEEDGFFEFELLAEDYHNLYSINIYDPKGNLVVINKDSANAIEYKCPVPFRIFPYIISIKLGDGKFYEIANDIRTLPFHNMAPFKTRIKVVKGDANAHISIPVYIRKEKSASQNIKIAEFQINGNDIEKTIPAPNEITVTLDIDIERNMNFKVKILSTQESFEYKIESISNDYTLSELNHKFNLAKIRYLSICSNFRRLPSDNAEIEGYLNQIKQENILNEVATLFDDKNNPDALFKANELINRLNEILEKINEYYLNSMKDTLTGLMLFAGYPYEDNDIVGQLKDRGNMAIAKNDYREMITVTKLLLNLINDMDLLVNVTEDEIDKHGLYSD